jgi:hypothetical protein
MSASSRGRHPLRVLSATVEAIKARQRLPSRDERRSSAGWLRPAWPKAFVINTHRRHLVELLLKVKSRDVVYAVVV